MSLGTVAISLLLVSCIPNGMIVSNPGVIDLCTVKLH